MTTAVEDTPIFDRCLMRAVRRWVGLGSDSWLQLEWDDGNGVSFITGVSR